MGAIREERFEATDESFTLGVIDAAGEHRELYLAIVEGAGIYVTVYHGTEHTLIPLNSGQGQELARWLVARVGLPAGLEFRGGKLTNATGS